MRKLAIIGASYLQQPLVEKAKEMGLYTLCFAWEEGAVCKNLVDEFYPISIVEKEQILAICQDKHIDGICTIASDVAAPTVAYIAEKMRLVGNSYACALKANNKYLMRQAFIQAEVDCPQFMRVLEATNETLDSLRQSFQLPIIVKPSDRSGSLGVTKVERWEDLYNAVSAAIGYSLKHEAMVEEFIEGREISVEFISYQGKHYPLQITDKVTTEAPHFVELEHHQPAKLSEDMFERIYAITERALTALDITNGASHSEYRITKEGRVIVMEIGARMGGDFIGSDLVRLSTGYDFVRGVIDVALGNFDESSIALWAFNSPQGIQSSITRYSGVYFLCEETKDLLPIMQEAMAHPEQHPEILKVEIANDKLHQVTCSADRSGYMIYQKQTKPL